MSSVSSNSTSSTPAEACVMANWSLSQPHQQSAKPIPPRASLIAGLKQATNRRRNNLLLNSPSRHHQNNSSHSGSHPGSLSSINSEASSSPFEYLSPPSSPSPGGVSGSLGSAIPNIPHQQLHSRLSRHDDSDLIPPRPDFYASGFGLPRPMSPNSVPARPLSSASVKGLEARKSWLFDTPSSPTLPLAPSSSLPSNGQRSGHRRASSLSSSLPQEKDLGVIGSPIKSYASTTTDTTQPAVSVIAGTNNTPTTSHSVFSTNPGNVSVWK